MAIPDGIASYLAVAAGSVVAPTVLGFGLLRWLGLGPAHGLRAAVGFGYVAGHYVLAHVTLAWLLLGRPGTGLALPVAALLVGLWLWRRSPRGAAAPAPREPSPWWSWLPVLLLVACSVEAFTAANAEPVRWSDEAVNWAAKAKVLYTAPGFDLRQGLAFFVEHPDYPLFNPLAQVLAFASAGRVLHFENRLPIQFFAVALLLLLSAALARRAHPLVAMLVLVAFAGTSFSYQAPTAYADVVLACATLAAAEALLRWRETGEPVFVAIACLATGAMVATKNEGLLLAGAVAAPFLAERLLRRRGPGGPPLPWRLLGWLFVPLAAYALHRGMNGWFGIQNDLTNPALGQGRGLVARVVGQAGRNGGPVLGYYGRMLVDPAQHRLLPLAFLVAAPLAACRGTRAWLTSPTALLLAAFLCATAGYMAVFVGTIYDLKWHLDVAADRTMQHVLPLAAVGLAAAIAPARAAGGVSGPSPGSCS